MTARRFSIRFSMAYALMMLGSGVQLPFLPLWLAAKGINASGIAFIVAGMMAIRMVSAPLFGWLADHFQMRRQVILGCAVLSFLAYLGLGFVEGFWPIALLALTASFFFAPVFPLSESYSVDASAALGLDYGRMRLWASLSFLGGSLGAGALLTKLDALDTAWLMAGAMGLTVLSALLLPAEPEALGKPKPKAASSMGAARFLFATSFPLFLLAAGLAQASHGMMYSFSSMHWQGLGFSSLVIGLMWAVAVLAEVTLLAFSNRVIDRFGPGTIFLLGITGGILRWLLLAFVQSLPILLVLQTLHAASFAMTHLGTMHMIRLMVPERLRNRAQSMHAALSGGILMSTSIWASGPLYHHFGAKTYLAMAGISVAALLIAVPLLRVSPRVRAAADT
jgi:MFS transporter, PPP family, 3-phenylpropionic acid transporter